MSTNTRDCDSPASGDAAVAREVYDYHDPSKGDPMVRAARDVDAVSDDDVAIRPQFARAGEVGHVPRNRMPAHSMDADTAYQIVHDELALDGNARLNVATFVTTWMEPQARLLIAETLDKNMIDKDE